MISKILSRIIGHMNVVLCLLLNAGRFRASFLSASVRGSIWVGTKGRIILKGKCQTKMGCFLNAHSGEMILGDGVGLNRNVSINCHERVEISDNVLIGEGVKIYDHDHVFSVEAGVSRKSFITSPVFIGKNTWIGSGAIILKGVVIGENVLVGAGSLVSKSIPSHTIFVQKRDAKLLN